MNTFNWTGNKIDLTMTYDHQIAGYSHRTAKTVEKDGWNATSLSIYSHAGTHMDAPHHFGVEAAYIDEYTPDDLIGRAHLINLHDIEPAGLIEVVRITLQAPSFSPGDSLLLRTDWSRRLGTPAYRDQLPRISKALAEWCADNKVKMLGVEPPSVADVNNIEEVTAIHQLLMRGNVTIIEGLCNLDQISTPQVLLIALPLKIRGGDGAPARVIAIEQ